MFSYTALPLVALPKTIDSAVLRATKSIIILAILLVIIN